MKSIKIRFVFILFVVLFSSNKVWGQFVPGTDLPNEDLTEKDVDMQGGEKPFVRWINKASTHTPESEFYSIYYGSRKWEWNMKYELFRVHANGTTCLFQANEQSGAALQFYTIDKKWRASLDNINSDLYLRTLGKLKIVTNQNHEIATFHNNKISFYDNLETTKEDITLRFGLDDNKAYGWIGTLSNNGCILGSNGNITIYMDPNNRTYIGGITPDEVNSFRAELKNKYKLFVQGGVLSEDFAIAPKSSWSDFVFNKNYRLKPLQEVEQFISINKHLPDVPSAKEVSENGYSQHDINKALLQKIEELTLYVIEQQKQIEALKAEKAN